MRSIAKKSIAWMLTAVMLISLLPINSMAAETAVETVIQNGEQLAALANEVNGGNSYEGQRIVLGQDIDMSGISFTAIGTPENPFQGIFDGNGYKISNLTLQTNASNQGLFGRVKSGMLENIVLENAAVSGDVWVGGIVGFVDDGTVENCIADGSINGRIAVAGIAGNLFGEAKDCINRANVIASEKNAGGITGYLGNEGKILSSSNEGEVQGATNTAGIVGEKVSGEVWRCSNQGSVSGTGNDTAGIAGLHTGGSVTSSYNTGSIFGGTGTCGGVVGYLNGGSVSNSYNRADVQTQSAQIGGIIGGISAGSPVTYCYSTGSVTTLNGGGNIGGAIGWNLEGAVSKCYYNSDVFSGNAIGSNDSNGEAYGKSTEELKSEATYEGFDFNSVWCIRPEENDGYPVFQSEKPTDEKVAADLEWLTFDEIKASNKSADNITENLVLPVKGAYGSNIFWSTDRPDVLLNSGVITPDASNAVNVTLTARITSGEVSEEKVFSVTVQPGTADKKPLHILQIGDSNTEFARITQSMNQILKQEYGNYSEGFLTLCKDFINIFPENFSISYKGNWRQYDIVYGNGELKAAQDTPFGLYVQSRVPEETITVEFVGSAVDIYYLAWTGAGTFQVTIDGVDKGTVIQTSNEFVTKKAVYEGLEYGSHTMELKNISGTINFYGADYRVDDAAVRKNISTWGKAGIQAKEYATVLNGDVFNSAITELNPDVVAILLGTNDNGLSSCSPEDLQTYLTTIIQRVQKSLPNAEIWLISTFETYNPTERLHQYWDTTFPNTAAETGVHYWSMGEWFGTYSTVQMADGWHSNLAYSKKIAEKMYEVIMGGTDVVGRNMVSAEENDSVKAGVGTSFEDLRLPAKVQVTLDDLQNTKTYADVVWSSDGYEKEKAGVYTLTGTIQEDKANRIYNPDTIKTSIRVELGEGYEQEDGLKLHYDFSQVEGTKVSDLAGNYDGTLSGNASVTDGMLGNGIHLPGNTDSYINIPTDVFADSDEITISTWVKMDTISTWTTLLGVGSDQQNYFVLAAKGTPGGTACGVTAAIKEPSGTEYRVKAPSELPIPVNQWCQVTYTQQYNIASLYLNGELVAQQEGMKTTLQDVVKAASSTAHLGAPQVWPDPAVKGIIDEVKIYNRALSAEEVKEETNQKNAAIEGEGKIVQAIAKINEIGTVEATDASKAKIDAARKAYDALTEAQRAKVTNAKVLTDAEEEYVRLTEEDSAIREVIKKINEIGTVEATDASKAKIDAARKAYDALTEAQRAKVTNIKVLTDAESTYAKLTEPGNDNKTISLSECTVQNIPVQYYNGHAKTPTPVVVYSGKTLILNQDYKVTYKNNVLIGTAEAVITGEGNYGGTLSKTFSIEVKKGAVYAAGNYKYKITNPNGTVSIRGVKNKALKKKLKTIRVASSVKIGGKSFKITKIDPNAFKGCKKAKKAVIGANIAKIGKKAFYNCKRLKKITIKSKKLKKVGKNTFKNIPSRAVIKGPKSKLQKYTQLLKGKGQKNTVRIR